MPIFTQLFHTFQHKWEEVSLASWRKYPTESRPDVLSVDILDRNYNPQTKVLTATRVQILKEKLPRFFAAIFGIGPMLCIEYSYVDPIKKTMILKSQNITFRNIMSVEETCVYTVSKENPEWTDFAQEANITAFGFGVSKAIENFSLDKFKRNALSGREIMEHAIHKVQTEAMHGYEYLTREVNEAMEELVRSTSALAEEQNPSSPPHTFKPSSNIEMYRSPQEQSLANKHS